MAWLSLSVGTPTSDGVPPKKPPVAVAPTFKPELPPAQRSKATETLPAVPAPLEPKGIAPSAKPPPNDAPMQKRPVGSRLLAGFPCAYRNTLSDGGTAP